ncbi:major facilitator superfamily (MFS) transporter [Candidatus Koribacter versatilis Ellin345]|uniref:Major facilitator superfamily (MFS) transporter n=2 Tax=Candidatus Korobacter versatilis TaxID=658062 RepID=Q1ISJ8_KORVE|nr:major facilitator superfamily (MFS) transporter [Candidatus Koribacter versatilis Ellin345]
MNSSAPNPDRSTSMSLIAVMLAGACTFLNVYCTQPLLPFLRRLFHASELQVSLTVSATTFGVAIAAPIVGLMAERIGRKKVIVPALFWLTVPTLLAATSTGIWSMVLWRFLQGICVPGIIAVMIAYIGEEFSGINVGSVMASYVTGTVFGGFLGRFIAGLVATHWHWRAAFVVIGVINLCGAIAVRQWLPKARNFKKAEDINATLNDMRMHLRNPRLLATVAMGFGVLFSLVGAFTYVNFYLAAPPFHLSSAALGTIFCVYLLGLIITPLSGRFLDRSGFRNTAIVATAFALTGLACTLSQHLSIVIVGLALFSSGIFIYQAAATVQTGINAGRARSSAAGLYVTLYYIGGSVGATALGWVWLWRGWHACVAAIAVASLLTLVCAFLSSSPTERIPARVVTESAEVS